MSQTTRLKRRRRTRTRTLAGLGILLALAGTIAALAPTLVGWGLGHGIIRSALERRINGSVAFDRLDLAWFGPQSVRGFAVTDAGGEEVATLDVHCSAGLFGLLLHRLDSLEIAVSGTVSGELRENGSTSFQDLFVKDEPDAVDRHRRAMEAPKPIALAGLPPTTLDIDRVTVKLRDAVSQRMIVLEDATGEVAYVPGEHITLDVHGTTTSGKLTGSVSMAGEIERLFDADGALTPNLASGRIDIELRSLPVPLTARGVELRSMRLTATSDDLTEQLVLSIEAEAVIDGTETGRLEGILMAERPVKPDGSLDLGLDRLTGRVVGRSVPTALFQPALAGTPILASRDIGPTIDIDAWSSDAATRSVTIAATAEAVQLEVAATIDPETRLIRGDHLRLAADVSPQLFSAATGMHIDRPLSVQFDLSAFSLPRVGEDVARQLRQAAATGTVIVATPATISIDPDRPPLFTVDDLTVHLDTSAAGDGLNVRGSATVDGAEASFDCSITGLLGEDGSFTFGEITPVGTVTLRGVKPATLARLLPDQANIIKAAVEGPIDAALMTTLGDDGLHARLRATDAALDLEATAIWRGASLHVAEGRATLTVTPELAAALQEGARKPILLTQPAVVSAEIEPFEVAPWPSGDGGAPAVVIRARLTTEDVVLDDVPGLVEPIGLRGLVSDITARLDDEPSLAAVGKVKLRRVAREGALGAVQYSVTAASKGEGDFVPEVSLEVTGLSVRRLERMLGKDRRAISQWLGDRGSVTAALAEHAGGYKASLAADFPHLAGEFVATLDEHLLTLAAEQPRISLNREAVQRFLAPEPGADGRSADAHPAALTVPADVPLTLTIEQLRLPRALFAGRPFDAAAADIDLAVTGGPLVISDPEHGITSIDRLELSIHSTDLAKGIDVSLTGEVIAAKAAEPGPIELVGKLSQLVDNEGALSPDHIALDMMGKVDRVPAALVDGLANLRGMLVAAVGPTMNVEATARNFSRTTGTLQARISASNGRLEGRAKGRNNALRIAASAPVQAELEVTAPLRNRLLYKIHPILADIRSTEQPLRVKLGNAIIPLDGDVSRLKADVEITVGAVELDSGSVTLGLLTLFDATNAVTIPGFIEPIVARVRKGIITYERFAVKLDKYTLAYSGRIDLNTRTVDLRTEIPLEGLAMSVKELRGYADKIIVPIVVRGEFGNLKTEIAPDFDLAGAAFEAGFRGLLNEALKDAGIPWGDLFDEILKKPKDPKPSP